MDYLIYHNKDLDGKGSAVLADICYDNVNMIGYDYGEKLDLRKFNKKTVYMVDVSLDMAKMFTLAKNSESFTWVDHHITQLDKFLEFSKDMSVQKMDLHVEDFVSYYIPELNFTYIYTQRRSALELFYMVCCKDRNPSVKEEPIRLLGQYDTWRNTKDKMLSKDATWKEALSFQYGCRAISLERLRFVFLGELHVDYIAMIGESILTYQADFNKSVVENKFFEFTLKHEGKDFRVIACNTSVKNSQFFDAVWNPEKHDIMMPFDYSGQDGSWHFSMYTTKLDLGINEIAVSFGGGGHKGACGFKLPFNKVSFTKKGIQI